MEKNLKEIVADKNLIACCGLYCGACGKYLKGACLGCKGNEKASWCKVRKCCLENNYATCADCQIGDPESCKKLDNFISRIISLFTKSDRKACIHCIKEKGPEAYAQKMTEEKSHAIKK